MEFIANLPNYHRNTVDSTRLAIAAREHLFAWAEEESIEFDLKREGILHIYRDKASFSHAAKVSTLLAQGGLKRQAVTPAEMRSIEPTLAGTFLVATLPKATQPATSINSLWDWPLRLHAGVFNSNMAEMSIVLKQTGRVPLSPQPLDPIF